MVNVGGLTARQVADRLGVELATVYAYASRGVLHRRAGPDGRTSLYDHDEVEALALRSRPRSARRTAAAVDVVIGTTISEIGDGWIRYRGRDLADLARDTSFEATCRLLWTGSAGDVEPPPPTTVERLRRVTRRVVGALPSEATVTSRLAVAAAAVSPLLPDAGDDVAALGSLLLDALVEALPLLGDDAPPGATPAERLWARCSPLPATRRRVAALDTALVLLAEHELATSTLAVRVAASTRASPAEAILSGLGAVSGPLHGRAAVLVHERLRGVERPDDGATAGTGHSVHTRGDPRYPILAEAVRSIARKPQRSRIEADVAHLEALGSPPPNVDLALGGLAYVADTPVGGTEAVFAVARTAGWLAHAHEESDETPLRFRGRTLYRGPRELTRPALTRPG